MTIIGIIFSLGIGYSKYVVAKRHYPDMGFWEYAWAFGK